MLKQFNKTNQYSIRKYSVGVFSVAVASIMFMGGTVQASDSNTKEENKETTESVIQGRVVPPTIKNMEQTSENTKKEKGGNNNEGESSELRKAIKSIKERVDSVQTSKDVVNSKNVDTSISESIIHEVTKNKEDANNTIRNNNQDKAQVKPRVKRNTLINEKFDDKKRESIITDFIENARDRVEHGNKIYTLEEKTLLLQGFNELKEDLIESIPKMPERNEKDFASKIIDEISREEEDTLGNNLDRFEILNNLREEYQKKLSEIDKNIETVEDSEKIKRKKELKKQYEFGLNKIKDQSFPAKLELKKLLDDYIINLNKAASGEKVEEHDKNIPKINNKNSITVKVLDENNIPVTEYTVELKNTVNQKIEKKKTDSMGEVVFNNLEEKVEYNIIVRGKSSIDGTSLSAGESDVISVKRSDLITSSKQDEFPNRSEDANRESEIIENNTRDGKLLEKDKRAAIAGQEIKEAQEIAKKGGKIYTKEDKEKLLNLFEELYEEIKKEIDTPKDLGEFREKVLDKIENTLKNKLGVPYRYKAIEELIKQVGDYADKLRLKEDSFSRDKVRNLDKKYEEAREALVKDEFPENKIIDQLKIKYLSELKEIYEKNHNELLVDEKASGILGTVTWRVYKDGTLEFSPTDGKEGEFDNGKNHIKWAHTENVNEQLSSYGKDIRKYKDKVKKVVFKGKVKANGTLQSMFYGYDKLEEIDFTNFDTTNATGMKSMLQGTALKRVDLSRFNTSNVHDLSYMFHKMEKLEEIVFGDNFNTSKVVDFSNMFDGAIKIKGLNLLSFDTRSAGESTPTLTPKEDLFKNTPNLTTVAVGEKYNISMEDFYTVTFYFGSENKTKVTLKVRKNRKIADGFIPTPSKEGYQFAGWSEDVSKEIVKDMELTPRWREVKKEKPNKDNNANIPQRNQLEENKPTPQAVPGKEKQPEMEKQRETNTPGKGKESTPKTPEKTEEKNTDKLKESSKQNDNNKVQSEENKPTLQAVPEKEKQPEMEKQRETNTPSKGKETTPKTPEKTEEKNTDKAKELSKQNDNNKVQSEENKPTPQVVPGREKQPEINRQNPQVKLEMEKQKEKSKINDNIKTQNNNKTVFKLKSLSGNDKITVEFDKVINADEILFNEIKDHKLINNIKEKLNVKYVRIFDIDLLEKGKVNKVTDNRTVRIALAEKNMKNIEVYHIKNNGELEKIQSKEENGELVFKTNHFSKFAFVNKVKGTNDIINNNNLLSQRENQEQEMPKDNSIQKTPHSKGEIRRVNHNTEKLPNTGKEEKGLAALGAFIAMALTFILFKRKE